MKKFILLAVILLAATLVAAQNTVIVIDNQTDSKVTVKCDDNVCTVVIKDDASQDRYTGRISVGPCPGIKAEQKLVREYFDGCNTTTCDGYGNCTSTLLYCTDQYDIKLLNLNDAAITQQPRVAVKPYYISDGPCQAARIGKIVK